MKQYNDFKITITTFLQLTGMSISQLADLAKVSNRSLTAYLNGNVEEIGSGKIERILDVIGINTTQYSKRLCFAKEVAIELKKILKTGTDITKWDKSRLASVSGKGDVDLFWEVNNPELFAKIMRSSMIDVSCTFEWFKACVQFYMDSKITKENLSSAVGSKAFNNYLKRLRTLQVETKEKNGKSSIPPEIALSIFGLSKVVTKMGGGMLFNTLTSTIPVISAAAAVLSIVKTIKDENLQSPEDKH